MIKREDIKSWVGSNYDMRLLIEALQDGDYGVLINLIHDCITELSQDKWVSVNPKFPDPNQKVKAIIQHCKSNETKEVVLDVVDDDDHLFEYEGCELSLAWGVVKWMPLQELPNDKMERAK